MPTTTYRYLFVDLLTNEIIAELPLTGVAFTQQLNQAGSFSGHILLSGLNDPATGVTSATYNVLNATIPAKTGIYVDRDFPIGDAYKLLWNIIDYCRKFKSDELSVNNLKSIHDNFISLLEPFKKYSSSDKEQPNHKYISRCYTAIFNEFKDREINVLEIGILNSAHAAKSILSTPIPHLTKALNLPDLPFAITVLVQGSSPIIQPSKFEICSISSFSENC